MAGILTTALLVGFISPNSANARTPEGMKKDVSDWKFTLGGAGGYFVDYEGSDDYDIKALPLFGISWRDIVSVGTVGGPGLNVKFLKIKGPTPKDRFVLSTSLGYFGGRDQDDNDALKGLGDLEGGATAKLSADYQFQNFGASFTAGQDLSGDRQGTTINAGLRYTVALGSLKTQMTFGTSTTWADDNYMDNVFGISATQAASSTFAYSVYTAASGFKDVGVNVAVRHFFNRNIGIMGQVAYKQLLGDAADSPIVDGQGSAGQFSALVGMSYNW